MDIMKSIEELSKKVGKTATETYNTVADKSGKLVEETKMKISISDKQNEITEIYENIGKAVYEKHKSGVDSYKEFTKDCKKIDKIGSEIEETNKKILFNKGLRTCSSCGEVIDLSDTYCGICGNKQKPVKIKDDKKEEKSTEEKEESKEKVCPQCGTISQISDKFCVKCGYKY